MATTGYTSWKFTANSNRMPEFTAPGLGRVSNTVTIDLEVGDAGNGVLYAMGGLGGGLTLYMEDGYLIYEYNLLILEQYSAKSEHALTAGKHTIEVVTAMARKKPGGPATVTLMVDGQEVGQTHLKRSVPLIFTASETFDVGIDLGSPVSLNYDERRPFAFDGEIKSVDVILN